MVDNLFGFLEVALKRFILALTAIYSLVLVQPATAQIGGGTGNKGTLLANKPMANFAAAPSQTMAVASAKTPANSKHKSHHAKKLKAGQTSGSGAPAAP